MSSQAAVHSIDELKNFRVALALYGEDTLGNFGCGRGGSAAERCGGSTRNDRLTGRTRSSGGGSRLHWHGRRSSGAIFKRRPITRPAMSEQKEALRKAEASLA